MSSYLPLYTCCRQTHRGPSLKNPLPLQSLTLPLGPLLLAQDGLAEICEGCPRSGAHNRPDNGAVCPVKDIEPQPLKK